MSARFEGRMVLVTGAAGGIGTATVRAFLGEGATVFASDLEPPTAKLGSDGGGFLAADITDRAAVDAMVAEVQAHAGRIDALVHAAALLGSSGPFESIDATTWARFIDVNLTGTFHVCQAVARSMIATGTQGRIVTIGSVNSFAAEPEAAPYVASKGGIRLLTKAMAVDLARHGILVNMIAPGPVNVPRNAELFARPELTDLFDRWVPLRAAGQPDDVAFAALFLADAAMHYVTGAELIVDGGTLAQVLAPPRV